MITELSPRERETVGLLAQGFSGKEIADRMGIGRYTVNEHLRKARRKLGARNSLHVAVLFVREQLLSAHE